MKISKRTTIKHRVVKAYNEKQRFKSSSETPALGDLPYRNIVIAGAGNTLKTSLGLVILINHVRHNPMLRLGQPNYVYLSRMEENTALRLWEYIHGRNGLDSSITDQINKRVSEMYDADDTVSPSDKAKRFSTAQFLLETERVVDVAQWFLSKGYTLKISYCWQNDICGILNNIREGRFVIRYNDGLTPEDCRARLLFAHNCLLIGIAAIYRPFKMSDGFSSTPAIRPTKALFAADRAVQCDMVPLVAPATEYERTTELIKNRGGTVDDRQSQSTVNLIDALIK